MSPQALATPAGFLCTQMQNFVSTCGHRHTHAWHTQPAHPQTPRDPLLPIVRVGEKHRVTVWAEEAQAYRSTKAELLSNKEEG